jgi:hypothetical protein
MIREHTQWEEMLKGQNKGPVYFESVAFQNEQQMAECKTNNKNYNHWKTTKKTKAGYKTLTL